MPRKISEERTRKEMKAPLLVGGVDPQLELAGWYLRDHAKRVLAEAPSRNRRCFDRLSTAPV